MNNIGPSLAIMPVSCYLQQNGHKASVLIIFSGLNLPISESKIKQFFFKGIIHSPIGD